MKLFQRLLVAPAALGLLAPVGAVAAELNLNDVSNYSSRSTKSTRVKTFSQFSDVYPTDWSYQALSKMLERNGCAPITSTGSMTRYEAAAILNKCLGGVAAVNEEERKLINEFSSELAVIKGRIDGVEAGMMPSGGPGLSTTSKVSGSATFVVGSVGRDDGTSFSNDGTVFVYGKEVNVETSFNGEDLLVSTFESGNFTATDPFGSSGVAGLESTTETSNAINLSTLYYQRPILGGDGSITFGPLVEQADLLGVAPSDYPTDTILDVLTYGGANAAYNNSSGAGAGVTYTKDQLSFSVAYVAEEATDADGSTGGIGTDGGSEDITTQLAWLGDGYTIVGAYTISDGGITSDASFPVDASNEDFTALGISGIYQVDSDLLWGLLPTSVSAGYGVKMVDHVNEGNDVEDKKTWSWGLIWDDFYTEGNTLGLGVGTAEAHKDDDGYDKPLAYELYYSIAVSDSITVTPALFIIEQDSDAPYKGG